MTNRDLIVLAVTTTGPDPMIHCIIDLAAVNVRTEQSWQIARPLTADELRSADTDTLNSFGYSRESLGGRGAIDSDVVAEQLADLAAGLRGNTIGGAFPQFSAAFLDHLLVDSGLSAGWHYRLAEIGALTAGAFGMEPTTIPKLSFCCRLWGVEMGEISTASGAANAAALCFRRLGEYSDTAGVPQITGVQPGGLVVVPDLPEVAE